MFTNQIENQIKMKDSSIIVIAIDESGSMSGRRWNNAVVGAK